MIKRDPNRYNFNFGNTNIEWTKKDWKELTQGCLKGSGKKADDYPQLILDYCKCTSDKIMKAMTKEHYNMISEKLKVEQLKELMPIIQDEVNKLNQRIDSTDKQRNIEMVK